MKGERLVVFDRSSWQHTYKLLKSYRGILMKRYLSLSILLFVLVFTGFTDAAYLRSFRQRGPAVAGLKSQALIGLHPSLPMGTSVTITNLKNGYRAVVTIHGRMAASASHIIDLSEGAAKALGMAAGGATQVSLEVIRSRPKNEAGDSGAAPDDEAEE
ncbi:MAG: septal ring lytic transglycosylase RlpA family protein [Treponema sp.]|jgi:rare lipoprotein A|nr:septal ring lytic transglycosylase RlpA family protein [Treponema sp.]